MINHGIKWLNPKRQQPCNDTFIWAFGYGSFRAWGYDHYICPFYRDKNGEYWDMVSENHGSTLDDAACECRPIVGWLPFDAIPLPYVVINPQTGEAETE